MGCDIQVFCEGFIDEGWGKNWINIDHWFRSDDFSEISLDGLSSSSGFNYKDINQGRRSYHLFYLLAGVRGSDDYNSYLPISKPKGIPMDMDPFIKSYYEKFWEIDFSKDTSDCHDASYLSLKEIKDSCYANPMLTKGWVIEEGFEKKLEGMRSGKYIFVDFVDIKEPVERRENRVYREWTEVYNNYLIDLINIMEEYKKERQITSDKDIRIVFWFDN